MNWRTATTWIKRPETWPKQMVILVSIWMVTLVGLVDYVTGYETFFFTFYLMAVALAAWNVGFYYGVLMAALSVVAWASAHFAAGQQFSSYWIPVWNAGILFTFYLVVVSLLVRLRAWQNLLEERVRQRTAELTRAMQERLRLEKELLETSEREQRRIGAELHDGLSQHLTGTALAGHLLAQKLAQKSAPELPDATRMVKLLEAAIEMTRSLSRSLHPAVDAGELTDHFQELAASTQARFKVDCRFECDLATPLTDMNIAAHLFRIAQEAVANAVRHGQAHHINIGLNSGDGESVLTITDDGVGLPDDARNGQGLGLHLMAYRADLIGGTFTIERLPTRGTRVTCALPNAKTAKENHVAKN